MEADCGYRGEPDCVEDPDFCEPPTQAMRTMKTNVTARHEGVNGKIKKWGAMMQAWRHSHETHLLAFRRLSL